MISFLHIKQLDHLQKSTRFGIERSLQHDQS